MELFSFVFTIFFMLLGPVKIIGPFARLTQDADDRFTRALAIRSALIASAVVAFLALAGRTLLGKYQISIDGLRFAGGLVLLLAALNTIFHKLPPMPANRPGATVLQIAVSPMAVPVIVPPAGVAAILFFMMLAPEHPLMSQAVAIALILVMVLNFLVMYFIRPVMKTAGLTLVLQLVGAVLVFIQVCLAVELILGALRHLGVLEGQSLL